MVHVLLKPGLENFEHYFTSVWDECNCVVVWAFFGIAFLWDWNENCPFPVLWPLLSFPNLLDWVQNFHSIIIFFFFFTLFYFTILYWFCHTLTWIRHGCIRAPNPECPSHLPPHIISLYHPHAPAPSILYPVSNIDWRFISYLIVYMFQCHSPKSSHPLPLSQSLKVHSIHLCLFRCLADMTER